MPSKVIGRNENVKSESEMVRKSITMPLTAVSDLGLQAISLLQSMVLIGFKSVSHRGVFCNMPFLTLEISLYMFISKI